MDNSSEDSQSAQWLMVAILGRQGWLQGLQDKACSIETNGPQKEDSPTL